MPCFLLPGFARVGFSCRPGDVLCPCLLLGSCDFRPPQSTLPNVFAFGFPLATLLALYSLLIDMFTCQFGLSHHASLSVALPGEWV